MEIGGKAEVGEGDCAHALIRARACACVRACVRARWGRGRGWGQVHEYR